MERVLRWLSCMRRLGKQSIIRGLQGFVLALGAPAGWYGICTTWVPGYHWRDELGLYVYMLVGTAAVFTTFGALLGVEEGAVANAVARFEQLSITDELTQLRNARYFWERFHEACEKAHRDSTPLSLVIFDLDHFKSVNDRFGHRTGDMVLRTVADTMREVTRGYELLARIGGEEFAIVLTDADLAAAKTLAERVRAAVEAESFDHAGLAMTISAGVGTLDEGISTAEQLFAAADAAVYQAKALGRNRVEAHSQHTRPTLEPEDEDSQWQSP